MTIDETIKLIDAVAGLVGKTIWPISLLWIILWFRSSIRTFMDNLGEFSFKGAGLEASAKTKQIQAAASLAAAMATSPREQSSPQGAAEAAAGIVSDTITPSVLRRASQARILWVDDLPDNNVLERDALQALGIVIRSAMSTAQALDALNHAHFDAVISDMARPSDIQAGYSLLAEIRARGSSVPLIIYSSEGSRPEYKTIAFQKGAFGSTDQPSELFSMVLSALQTK